MPSNFNEKNRHKNEPARYQVINWRDYNNALRNRYDFTVYFTEEVIDEWHPTKAGGRGPPQLYSALAIMISLMLRQVFCLPLRQTQGFINALIKALGIAISAPDFSSLSKRSAGLPRHKLTQGLEPGSVSCRINWAQGLR